MEEIKKPMEEDNSLALFSWNNGHHHKNNNSVNHIHSSSFSLKDQSSETSHQNSNTNTNQSGNASSGLGLSIKIKIKGPTTPTIAAAIKNKQQPCYVCHICNQGFTSGQALGGHMGIHSLSIKQDQKDTKDSSCIAKSNNGSSSQHTCSLCGKTFHSNKSLCGHMRVHSQSVRKSGIESPLRWPVFRKRRPRFSTSSLSCRFKDSPSCLELNGFQEVDPLMQEAAYTLLLMSKGIFEREEPNQVASGRSG